MAREKKPLPLEKENRRDGAVSVVAGLVSLLLVLWSPVTASGLTESLALFCSHARGACWSPTLSSVPGARSGIELRVRVPPTQDIGDRMRREGPRKLWFSAHLSSSWRAE